MQCKNYICTYNFKQQMRSIIGQNTRFTLCRVITKKQDRMLLFILIAPGSIFVLYFTVFLNIIIKVKA
jgi:hypothetical protein